MNDDDTKTVVQNCLVVLMAQKALREGRTINAAVVIRETGLGRSTVEHWVKNKVTRFDAPIIKILCEYFNCEPGDLIVIGEVKKVSSDTEEKTPTKEAA